MLFSSLPVGKFDQSQAAEIGAFVISCEGAGEDGLVVKRLQVIEVDSAVFVTQRGGVRFVKD